nr:zinc finger, CCHC-type [Tanacetum cinerariifolium]
MGDENPIRTLGDYSRPSHEGYRNTIELLKGNNMVPLRSDTIRLVKNECSFHRLRSKDPNQHLKDFLKLMDSFDLDGENKKRMRLRRIIKLRNDILMFQQHHGESLSEAWTRFKDLLQKVPHHGIDLWLQVQIFMTMLIPSQDEPLTNRPVYCMENPKQAFLEYASSRIDEVGGKWYTFKPEQNNLGDTYNLSWKSHPNLRWRQPQNFQNSFSNPPNQFQPNRSILNHPSNNRLQNFNNQSNIEGLVYEFMESQDARLSKFEADFKQQKSKMTNKIDTVLNVITDQIAGTLPSDTVKNPKPGTHPVSYARSYLVIDPQCSSHPSTLINAIKAHFNDAIIKPQ